MTPSKRMPPQLMTVLRQMLAQFSLASVSTGGPFALAAARALVASTDLSAREVVERALDIAADICIYTNRNVVIDELTAG